jgi:hypothetical protein
VVEGDKKSAVLSSVELVTTPPPPKEKPARLPKEGTTLRGEDPKGDEGSVDIIAENHQRN